MPSIPPAGLAVSTAAAVGRAAVAGGTSTATPLYMVPTFPSGFPNEIGSREGQYPWTLGNSPWVVYESGLGPSTSTRDFNVDTGNDQGLIWLVLFVSLLFGLAIGVIPFLVKIRAARHAEVKAAIEARRAAFKKSTRPLPPVPGGIQHDPHARYKTSLHYNRERNPCKNSPNGIVTDGGHPKSKLMMYQPKSAPPPRFRTPSPGSRGYRKDIGFRNFTHHTPRITLHSRGRYSTASDASYEYDNIDGENMTSGHDNNEYVLASGSNIVLGITDRPMHGLMAASTEGSVAPSYFSRASKGAKANLFEGAEMATVKRSALRGGMQPVGVQGNALEHRHTSTDSVLSGSMPPPVLPRRSKAPALPISEVPDQLSLAALARSPEFGRFRALYTFAGSGKAGEMVFEAGALLFVHDQSHPDWWAATAWPTGQFGFVPAAFLTREETDGIYQEPIALASRLDSPSISSVDHKAGSNAFGGYGDTVLDWDADNILSNMSFDVIARLTPDVAFDGIEEEIVEEEGEEEKMFITSRPGSLLSGCQSNREVLFKKREISNI